LPLNCGRCCSCAAASSLLYKLAGSRNEDMATSHIGPMSDVELGPDSEAADDNLLNQSSAFVPRRVALSLLRSRRQIGVFGVAFRRGIHCECCIHQCAYKELMEYCRSTDSPLIQWLTANSFKCTNRDRTGRMTPRDSQYKLDTCERVYKLPLTLATILLTLH